MTSLSQDTYAAPGLILSALGSGGSGGQISTFASDVFITSTLTVLEVNAGTLSTIFLEAESAFISSISTAALILDAATLTTAGGTELLLNGIPLATTSNISSLADWAFDPAVSTLNMNSFCTIGSSGFFGSGTVSSLNVEAQTGLISSLVCQDISTVTFTAFSTIHAISSISSSVIQAESGLFSSISSSVVLGGAGTFSSINGATFPQVIPAASTVSTFVDLYTSSFLVSSITTSSAAASDLNISAQRYINTETTGISTTVDGGFDVFTNSFYRVNAKRGNRGEISMTADPGAGGIAGEINMTANGGIIVGTGVGNGGVINLTANSALAAGTTSAIKFSAAGINSYAGAIPSIGSVLGYNFMYGTLGTNICAGLPPGSLPNTPGTTYLYGTNGVVVGSDLYAANIYGYWGGLPNSPSNLSLYGRQTAAGNSYVNLSNVGRISFDSGSTQAITGVKALSNVSSINGIAYPIPLPPILFVDAVVALDYVSAASSMTTQALSISSINNAAYPPPAPSIPQDLTISSLTAANYISSAVVQGVSSVTGPFLNIAGGDALNLYSDNGVTVAGGVELYANAVFASSITFQDATSSFITGLSSINGVAYPPPPVIPTDLVVNTLTANISVSTQSLLVSSINNAEYPPPASIPQDLVVSTLTVSSISYLPKIETCSSIGWAAGAAPTISFSPTQTTVSYGPLSVSSIIDVSTIRATDLGFPELSTSLAYGSGNTSLRAADTLLLRAYAGSILMLSPSTNITGDTTLSAALNVSSIKGVSTINGVAYPGPVAIPYTLTGTTGGGVIVNAPTGSGNPFTQNVFAVVTTITFNLPAVLKATDSVYYDGYLFTDWDANFNSFWGVSYTTNTFATPTDILGSTSNTANALQFTNFNQIYLPLNQIIPPTHITAGGTVTLKIYCNPTSANHYLTVAPTNTARIGVVSD